MKNGLTILITALLLLLTACGTATEEGQEVEESIEETEQTETTEPEEEVTVEENPIVTITMESGDEIVLELYPNIAFNTVANFISLAQDGFYDGLIFHRVIPGFMIQGGDPEGTGMGGPGYSIEGEFSANGFENPLLHERGVISVARTNDPNSGGSQFFIMVEHAANLDGQYAGFGKVIDGIEVVDAIVSVDRDAMDKPNEEQRMATVTVDTKGYEYPEPKKIEEQQ
ncbi:peptidylprolyl isomerase [Halalkalibacter akibai]|uniref:Peptidyl-prolyl cis-trans isomerase n=1 Tax=Halalkalibacter akibai (strain ATCC 43226 / DSM 21942 / CIP 109018 / JCM 9157 / 1139) TaxID=1236973 RepID=W4QZD5_HALA3|nr:peptidylprolyl isomerase [Halalkalibacter akibai]GAE37277.1 peptidyl-prolyl cis-trans isomerase [Halalkalibacter akibai JCM 9157]